MSYKTNYLKSCFITVLLLLLYIVIIKTIIIHDIMKETAGLHYEEFIITISACFIVLAGFVAPLSFFLAGKYTTHIKEPARPTKEKTQAEIEQEEAAKLALARKQALNDQTRHAISCNPRHQKPKSTSKNQTTKSEVKPTANNSFVSAPQAGTTYSSLNTRAQSSVSHQDKSVFAPKTTRADDSTIAPSTNDLANSTPNEGTNGASTLAQTPKFTPKPEDYLTIYISNIPYKVNDNGLKELLKPFGGTIYSVHLSRDPVTKKRKGIAFIRMSKPEAAEAINKLNGFEFKGRTLVVKIANDHGKKPTETM